MQKIREQVDLLHAQAEQWQPDHRDAMYCRDVEELATFAVHLWAAIKSLATRHPIDHEAADAEEQTRVAWDIYRTLDHAMSLIERVGEQFRGRGYQLDGWSEFKTARDEVATSVAVPFEKVLRGLRDVSAGRVKSLGDVRRELQDRLRR